VGGWWVGSLHQPSEWLLCVVAHAWRLPVAQLYTADVQPGRAQCTWALGHSRQHCVVGSRSLPLTHTHTHSQVACVLLTLPLSPLLPLLRLLLQAVSKQSDLCDLLFALKPGSVLGQQGLYSSLVPATNMPPSAHQAPDEATTAAAAAAAAGGPGAAAAGASAAGGGAAGSSKVNMMCTAVRQAVQQLPSSAEGSHLKVVVTSYARWVRR
jgi:hypothetical protein